MVPTYFFRLSSMTYLSDPSIRALLSSLPFPQMISAFCMEGCTVQGIGLPTWLCISGLPLPHPVQGENHDIFSYHVATRELDNLTLNSSSIPKHFSKPRMFSSLLMLVIKIKNAIFFFFFSFLVVPLPGISCPQLCPSFHY